MRMGWFSDGSLISRFLNLLIDILKVSMLDDHDGFHDDLMNVVKDLFGYYQTDDILCG
jgi:hypothetical protein